MAARGENAGQFRDCVAALRQAGRGRVGRRKSRSRFMGRSGRRRRRSRRLFAIPARRHRSQTHWPRRPESGYLDHCQSRGSGPTHRFHREHCRKWNQRWGSGDLSHRSADEGRWVFRSRGCACAGVSTPEISGCQNGPGLGCARLDHEKTASRLHSLVSGVRDGCSHKITRLAQNVRSASVQLRSDARSANDQSTSACDHGRTGSGFSSADGYRSDARCSSRRRQQQFHDEDHPWRGSWADEHSDNRWSPISGGGEPAVSGDAGWLALARDASGCQSI